MKDSEAWHVAVHGVSNSCTQLSNYTTKYSLETLVGHKQNLVHTRTQGKEKLPTQKDGARPACECWGSPVEAQVSRGLPRQQGLWERQREAYVLLKKVPISPTIGLPGGWSTDWRTIIQLFSHCYERCRPLNGLPNLGIQQGTEKPRESDFEG